MSEQTESSLELELEKPDLSDTVVRTDLIELTCLICCVLSASKIFMRISIIFHHWY